MPPVLFSRCRRELRRNALISACRQPLTMTTWLECHECNEMFEVSNAVADAMHHWRANPATLFSVSIAQRILNGETQFQRWTEKRKPIREMTMHLMQLKNDLYKNHWRERRNWNGVSVRKLAAHYHCSEDQTRQAMLELQKEYPAPKRNK